MTNQEELIKNIQTNKQQRERLEKLTQDQNKNVVWHMARMRRLTASNFGRVIQNGDVSFLVSENEATNRITIPMRWGLLKENTARQLYAQKQGVVVDNIGFLLSESGMLGGTPDGIVKSEKKLIEIKCPYILSLAHNKGKLDKLIKGGNHWLKINKDGVIDFNMRHKQGVSYYHQIQGCLYLAGDLADSCDLIVWGPSDWLVVNVKKNGEWFLCYGHYLEHLWRAKAAPVICNQELRMVSVYAFFSHFTVTAQVNNMEKRSWPTISELEEGKVYAMVNFEGYYSQRQAKILYIVTVLDENLKEKRIWSVTMINNMITKNKLPHLMCYEGLKNCKGGKKMHMVNFAPITDHYKWIREYCNEVSKIK